MTKKILKTLKVMYNRQKENKVALGEDFIVDLFDLLPTFDASRNIKKVFFSANEKYGVLITETHAVVV